MSKPNAAYQIKANPPHYGNILELIYSMDNFDKIYAVMYDKPTLLSTDQCIEMLKPILDRIDKDKFIIVKSKVDFEHMNNIPEFMEKNNITHIITASPRIYANLKGKGFPYIAAIPHATGYYDDYQQIAYGRGFLLDRIKTNLHIER